MDPASQNAATDAEFIKQLQRVGARRVLEDTPYSAETLDLVAKTRIADAVEQLEAKAVLGNRDANVVLARLNWVCEGNDATNQSAESLDATRAPLEMPQGELDQLPAELRRRIEVSRMVEQRERANLSRACGEAQFDPVAIDVRLRDAAEAGHEASLWEVGRRSLDPAVRHKNWLSAAMLGYVPAQVGLAESLMAENLKGDRRNRGRMNFWLEAAARQSPRALMRQGECRLNGCNAQPPDAESAVPLLREAVVQGESGAFAALASISTGDPAAPSDVELYGLQSFLQQLNELGCYGAANFGPRALESRQSLHELGNRLSPGGLDDAKAQAGALWREHGLKARQVRGCD